MSCRYCFPFLLFFFLPASGASIPAASCFTVSGTAWPDVLRCSNNLLRDGNACRHARQVWDSFTCTKKTRRFCFSAESWGHNSQTHHAYRYAHIHTSIQLTFIYVGIKGHKSQTHHVHKYAHIHTSIQLTCICVCIITWCHLMHVHPHKPACTKSTHRHQTASEIRA